MLYNENIESFEAAGLNNLGFCKESYTYDYNKENNGNAAKYDKSAYRSKTTLAGEDLLKEYVPGNTKEPHKQTKLVMYNIEERRPDRRFVKQVGFTTDGREYVTVADFLLATIGLNTVGTEVNGFELSVKNIKEEPVYSVVLDLKNAPNSLEGLSGKNQVINDPSTNVKNYKGVEYSLDKDGNYVLGITVDEVDPATVNIRHRNKDLERTHEQKYKYVNGDLPSMDAKKRLDIKQSWFGEFSKFKVAIFAVLGSLLGTAAFFAVRGKLGYGRNQKKLKAKDEQPGSQEGQGGAPEGAPNGNGQTEPKVDKTTVGTPDIEDFGFDYNENLLNIEGSPEPG